MTCKQYPESLLLLTRKTILSDLLPFYRQHNNLTDRPEMAIAPKDSKHRKPHGHLAAEMWAARSTDKPYRVYRIAIDAVR